MNTKNKTAKTADASQKLPDMDEHDPLLAAYNDGNGDQRAQAPHSPLPWHVSTNAAFPENAEIRRRTGYRVADCDAPNAVANARLIVASVNNAGKLAEALRRMMDAFAYNAEQTVASEGESALQSDVRRAREALANWEGVE